MSSTSLAVFFASNVNSIEPERCSSSRPVQQSCAGIAIPNPGLGIGVADLIHGCATLAPLTHLDGTERRLPLMTTMAQPGQLAEAGDIVIR